jgi:hypothetical protein
MRLTGKPHHVATAPCAHALFAAVLALTVSMWPWSAQAQEWAGHVGVETRGFFSPPLLDPQSRAVVSLAVQPEYYRDWGAQSLLVVPFARLDSADPSRTHADMRELVWRGFFERWEFRAGIGKVFWGVTESQHLVDIINQTDFVENIDSEDKLGQPMINVTALRSWGALDLFVLPGFRTRTFPGENGRLRLPGRIATELTQFAASSKKRHVDLAARWSHTLGSWDVGVSHFYGTSRDPQFLLGADTTGIAVLIPRYDLIHQTGLDLQATTAAWLWKLEMVHRSGQGDRFVALTGGIEYTFANVRGSGIDVGVIGEYLFDDRGTLSTNLFEDDVYLAARLEFGDAQSTRLLAGAAIDRDTAASFVNVEASRRLGGAWRASLEARLFVGIPDDDVLVGFRDDDHLQLDVSWYF